ncbi:ABC transporter permease [Acholeplasma sp. OttesenSCG-928-E16]|nr:ABC transporter permease [Acholeplasma sp. OttesenSCG-928-E16]
MKSDKVGNVLVNLFIVIVFGFVYIPIIMIMIFSFNQGKGLTNWSGFSFKWYVELFTNSTLRSVIFTTIIIAVISTIISTIVGTLAAVSLANFTRKTRNTFLQLNNIPIMNPEIVTAISLFLLFGSFMIPRGYATLLLSHITFSIPYVVITVYPKVRQLDPNIVQAAYDLGATPTKALFKVVLPQIKGAMIAGASIAFTMSFDDFAISYFATMGTPIQNISTFLYLSKRPLEYRQSMNALSTLIVMFIGIKVVFDILKSKKKNKGEFAE